MVDRASYKSIRDQLISLSVDIEDKAKICALLERKIENERSLLGQVEGSLNEEYDSILEAEIKGHKENSGQKTSSSHKLMQHKSDMVARCQELMDLVKEQERELSAEVRSVYKDAEQVIEAEKKNFRSGYEDRLQKFIAGKASEYKESTAKALHPEISRLQMMHEQELSAAQLAIQAEERSIQEVLSAKLQARLEEERLAAKDELKLTAKALQDKSSADGDIVKREHRRQLQRLADDLERDLEKHRLFLKDKAQRGRDRAHAEMQQLQHSSQQRVTDLQQRHVKHIENLQDQHEKEIQALRRQAEASSKSHQANVRKQLQRSSGDYDDSDNEDHRSPPSKSKSKSTGRHSPNKTTRSSGPSSASSLHLDDFSDDEGSATTRSVENTAEEEIEIAAVVRAGQEERDKQLQAEIRALESETIRLERQWRARAEAEEKAVLATVAVEEDYLQVRRQRSQRAQASSGSGGAEEDVAELVVLREQLVQQLQAMRAQSERTAQEEREVTAEIRTYREGVAAHRARISDKQEQHRLHLRELQLEAGPKLRELREQVDSTAAQIKDGAERCRRQAVAVDKDHAVELAKLDSQVKTEVGRREDEIENLRDAVEAENTKIVRLERLIKQYSSSDTGPTPSNPTASGSGKARVQDISSNRSTASSYISAGSTTVSGASRLSAPRTRPERAVSGGVSGGGAAGLRGSTTREVESVQPPSSSRPSTGTRNRSLSSTTGQSGSTARAAALPTPATALEQNNGEPC